MTNQEAQKWDVVFNEMQRLVLGNIQMSGIICFLCPEPFPGRGSRRDTNLLHTYTYTSFCVPNNKTHFSFPLEHGLYHIFYRMLKGLSQDSMRGKLYFFWGVGRVTGRHNRNCKPLNICT